MRTNKLREHWAAGKGTVNGWCGIPSSFSAEIMAHAGFESVTIDCQHGLIDYQMAVTMLQAISTTDVVPLVRVPWREPGIIQKMLDAGSYGIICPMVNSRAQAEELVACASYPPLGSRSFGPIRATVYGGADYPTHANDQVLTIAMIETSEAMDNLVDIVTTPGLDGIYVGPADLANSMGIKPGFDPTDPTVDAAILEILREAKKAGIFAGIHCGFPTYIKRMWQEGYHFCSMMSDTRFLAMQAASLLEELRSEAGGPQSSTY